MTRKLARIVEIEEIKFIPEADKICAYRVDGWWVVDSIGKYQVKDLAIYCEVDSWIPHELAPFLSKGQEPREYEGVKGERLRTMKLRGTISQGLLLPIDLTFFRDPGTDVTKLLGIQKWEAPIPAELAGVVKGPFPSFIPKTDQERCQNLHDEIFIEHYHENYEVTIKLDGTSCTIYYKDENVGVCGRNWELTETESNTLWKCARSQGIIEGLQKLGRNLAIQGEVIGEGIQKNKEKIKGQKFYIFDIYDIDAGRYLNHNERFDLCLDMFNHRVNTEDVDFVLPNYNHVPILGVYSLRDDLNIEEIDDLLEYADGASLNPKVNREGLVFKSLDSDFTFKAISNKWLLKNE